MFFSNKHSQFLAIVSQVTEANITIFQNSLGTTAPCLSTQIINFFAYFYFVRTSSLVSLPRKSGQTLHTTSADSLLDTLGSHNRKSNTDATKKSYLRNKAMRIRIVAKIAVSSILVAEQKKAWNALFTRPPRLYTTIRIQ